MNAPNTGVRIVFATSDVANDEYIDVSRTQAGLYHVLSHSTASDRWSCYMTLEEFRQHLNSIAGIIAYDAGPDAVRDVQVFVPGAPTVLLPVKAFSQNTDVQDAVWEMIHTWSSKRWTPA